MPRLRDLQLFFLQSIFARENTGFYSHIVPDGLFDNQQMAVYRDNVFGCLIHALENTYPVILQLVGKEFFKRVATEYSYQNPSVSGDLHRFGSAFAEFSACFSAASELTYLPEVARLEWLCHEVFYEADCEPLDINALAKVPATRYDDLKFKLHPATRLFASSFPVDKIWKVNQPGYCGDQTVNLDMGGCKLLIKRNWHHVDLQILTEGEWTFLQGIESGMEFINICEVTLQVDPFFSFDEKLRQWVAQSTIVDFTIHPNLRT